MNHLIVHFVIPPKSVRKKSSVLIIKIYTKRSLICVPELCPWRQGCCYQLLPGNE